MMRTVSRLTREMRRARAYRLTEKWQLAERTRQHEAELLAEAAEFAAFEAELDCIALNKRHKPIPDELLGRIWSYLVKKSA